MGFAGFVGVFAGDVGVTRFAGGLDFEGVAVGVFFGVSEVCVGVGVGFSGRGAGRLATTRPTVDC